MLQCQHFCGLTVKWINVKLFLLLVNNAADGSVLLTINLELYVLYTERNHLNLYVLFPYVTLMPVYVHAIQYNPVLFLSSVFTLVSFYLFKNFSSFFLIFKSSLSLTKKEFSSAFDCHKILKMKIHISYNVKPHLKTFRPIRVHFSLSHVSIPFSFDYLKDHTSIL